MSGIISEVYKEAGDIVQAGDIIAKIQVVPDMVNLSSAESRVERAQLAANQSRSNYERDKKLYENEVISKEEFDKVELQYKTIRKSCARPMTIWALLERELPRVQQNQQHFGALHRKWYYPRYSYQGW